MTNEQFIKYQPILYKLFTNSKRNNRLANSYLLYGDINSPIKEAGLLLCESINCQKDIACHKCNSCIKFEKGLKTDFFFIDGENKTIKKEDIVTLEKKFVLTALEKNQKQTYLINHIENITNEAINALLKFLEEPKGDTIGILTTTNIEKVLKTIISRSIKVKVNSLPSSLFIDDIKNTVIEYNKNKRVIDISRAYILSRFFSSKEECLSSLKDDESFFIGYDLTEGFLNELSLSIDSLTFYLMKENYNSLDNKCYNWLYLILTDIFTSIITSTYDENNPFIEVMKELKNKNINIASGLKEIKKLNSLSKLNLSLTLNSIKIINALKEVKND